MTVPQPVVCGVYLLFKDRSLTYVGKSRNVYARIDEHRANGRQFDYATVTACPVQDMDWIEAAMIRAMAPLENVVLKPRKKAPVSRLDDYRPEPKRSDVLPSDPAMVVSKAQALQYAAHFRLSGRLKDAIADGSMPSKRSSSGRGVVHIKVGDLRAWCAQLAEAA